MLPPEFIIPDYGAGRPMGTTIANVPATIARLFDVPFNGLPPLPESHWRPLGNPKRVVLLILDALGRNLLEEHPHHWAAVRGRAAVDKIITSVFPSTTVTCLSSLWTGHAPSQHALVSLFMLFPEYATVGQMLGLSPRFGDYPDALVEAGLKPEEFLPVPSLPQQLAQHDIPTHSFKPKSIIQSALSKMHDRGVKKQHGSVSFADLLGQITAVLEEEPSAPLFLSGYWPTIDTLSHAYTPHHPIVEAELQTLFYQIEQFLLRPLSPSARQDTVLLIVADHGQIPYTTPHVAVPTDPALQDLLLFRGAGEARAPYLYARQGQQEALLAYLRQRYEKELFAFPSAELLEMGLFGPPPYPPELSRRLGDVIALMRDGRLWLNDAKDDYLTTKFRAMHGGLTAAEMFVPWLGVPL